MKHCIISFMPRVQLNNAVANSIVSSSSRYSLKVLVANIDYDDFKGKLGVGRVHSGSLQKGQTVGLGRPDCPVKAGKISELFVFDNLGRTVRVAVLRGPQFCPGSVLFQALFFFFQGLVCFPSKEDAAYSKAFSYCCCMRHVRFIPGGAVGFGEGCCCVECCATALSTTTTSSLFDV